MIRLLTAALLFASFNTVAQTEVPNVFVDGTAASAAEVNENFGALETLIDELKAEIQALQTQSATFATQPYILGVSASTTSGKIQIPKPKAGYYEGTRGATQMCRTTYPSHANAHLCTVDEVYRALSTDGYDTGFSGIRTYTVTGLPYQFGSASTVVSSNASPLDLSCTDLLNNAGDVALASTLTVYLDANGYGGGGGGAVGHMVDIRVGACSDIRPVLCCR